MATETVQKILEKERQADANVVKAKQMVAESIEQAKKEAEVRKKQIIDDANKKAQELMAKVQLDVDKMYDNARTEAEKRKVEILGKSSNLKNNAIKIVSEVIF